MRIPFGASRLAALFIGVLIGIANSAPASGVDSGEKKLNNLVTVLLDVSSSANGGEPLAFSRSRDGWIFISTTVKGRGAVHVFLDEAPGVEAVIARDAEGGPVSEAMHYVRKGRHTLRVERSGKVRVEKLVVRAIPELFHSGLGWEPTIRAYGPYDLNFLRKDVLPNLTTMAIPSSLKPAPAIIDAWHRQGKRWVAEVGISPDAKSAEDHFKYWTSFYDQMPFIDGLIVDEFIINTPMNRLLPLSADRQKRLEQEQQQDLNCAEAIKRIGADSRYQNKTFYAYFGGSGKTLNQEVIGPTLVRTLIDTGSRISLERYLHERSSEKASRDALDELSHGIADWEAKEPGAENHMVIAFGSFNMPPGGLNKLPNVDYLVWMDQQVNRVVNDPALAGIDGLEWWTTAQSDEETVRWVGRLYRHYAIEGKTNLLSAPDPLFLTHIDNADFARGTAGWTIQAAEKGSVEVKSFPRYGRIEGRFMGLGRPADPEHIGDTFLSMKRSAAGPNAFSQTITNLQPGRLYSMKMFSCDYRDLINPKAKSIAEAHKFTGTVTIDGVDLDTKRSFAEMFASSPEPKIPVWITYHWKVFRARAKTARLTVSDWPDAKGPGEALDLEQAFNFLEIEPYRE